MRILIDTNVLISTMLFPDSLPSNAVNIVAREHTLVLCSHVIDELHRNVEKKFKEKSLNIEKFLSKFSYELIYTPDDFDIKEYPLIRDRNDLPVLVSAVIADVDFIISGDKDLLSLDIEKPDILTPKEFLEKV